MEITPNLLQAIANYLVTKPYMEVAGLLTELQKETSIESKTEEVDAE